MPSVCRSRCPPLRAPRKPLNPIRWSEINALDSFSFYNAGLLLLAVATSIALIVGSFYVFNRVSSQLRRQSR